MTAHVWRCRWGRLTCRMRHQSDRQLMSSQGWNIPRVTQLSRITSMDMCSNHVQEVKVKTSYSISYIIYINIHSTSTEYTRCSGYSNRTVSTPTWSHAPFPSGLWWLETWFCRLLWCHIWPFCRNVIIIISSCQTFSCHAVTNCVWVPGCLQRALTFDWQKRPAVDSEWSLV